MKMVEDPPNLLIIYVFRLIKLPKKILGAGGYLGTPHPMGLRPQKTAFGGSWTLLDVGLQDPKTFLEGVGRPKYKYHLQIS